MRIAILYLFTRSAAPHFCRGSFHIHVTRTGGASTAQLIFQEELKEVVRCRDFVVLLYSIRSNQRRRGRHRRRSSMNRISSGESGPSGVTTKSQHEGGVQADIKIKAGLISMLPPGVVVVKHIA